MWRFPHVIALFMLWSLQERGDYLEGFLFPAGCGVSSHTLAEMLEHPKKDNGSRFLLQKQVSFPPGTHTIQTATDCGRPKQNGHPLA